jgi:hypothetical protein
MVSRKGKTQEVDAASGVVWQHEQNGKILKL